MFDTHCHLAYKGMDSEKAIGNAKKAGLQGIVNCGYPRDLDKAMEIAEKHKGFVFQTFGLHPVDIIDMSEKEIADYFEFIRNNWRKCIAIGECGLDYHWFKRRDSIENQLFKKTFSKSLKLAKELDLPIVLHTRKAEEECYKMVIEHDIEKAVFHCYSGNLSLADKIFDSGFFISIATNLLRSKTTKKLAQRFPLEYILTETDSPFLSPVPGQKNEPANVKMVVEEIAKAREVSFELVDKHVIKNAKKFFKI
ncbi:MAG: TatD family hydrolase [Candidatus Aenigmarchaeota archaeon]|nr:TatD family hydrolase [Candidatus Aenigmarchaeota archaeon]